MRSTGPLLVVAKLREQNFVAVSTYFTTQLLSLTGVKTAFVILI